MTLVVNQQATENTRFKFLSSQDQVKAFQRWLQNRLHQRLFDGDDWWVKYVTEAYKKGTSRAFDAVKRPSIKPDLRKERLPWYEGSKEEFLRSAFNRPASVEKVKLLASRVYTELEGITEEMSMKLTRALTDGLILGKSPRTLAKEISDTIDGITRARAEAIAQTEIVRVHAEAQLDSMEALGVDEVGVMVELDTAGDGRVCPKCRSLNKIVLKVKEARGVLPVHVRCRCAFIPANVGEDHRGQVRGKSGIERAFKEAGLSKRISKERPAQNADIENRSFFADCPRDPKGRCLPLGGKGIVEKKIKGKVVRMLVYRATKEQIAKAREVAKKKAAKNPKPTEEEVQKYHAYIAAGGNSADYETKIRPKSKDRPPLRRKLIRDFGDGKTAPCIYCGLKLDEKTVSMDKIYIAPQGGRYKYHNVVCSCEQCNKKRGPAKWKEIVWNPISNR